MTAKRCAFLDANAFLHYRPIAEIDWCALLGANAVTLVVCMPVIHEIDEKQRDPHLGLRAKRVIGEIRSCMKGDAAVRPGVVLEVYNVQPRREDFPNPFAFDRPDDQIVYLAMRYAADHQDGTVCVVAEDVSFQIKCESWRLPYYSPDESDRLENPGDEKDKMLKELQRKIRELENRHPHLSVLVKQTGSNDRPAARLHYTLVNDWVKLDPDAEIEKQRKTHRKYVEQTRSSSISGLLLPTLHLAQDAEAWKQFTREFEAYLDDYRKYIHEMNSYRERIALTLRFDLFLLNDGGCAATEVDVRCAFPSKIAWLEEFKSADKDGVELLAPPMPPSRPESASVSALASDRHASTLLGKLGGRLESSKFLKAREETQVAIEQGPSGEYALHVHLERLKHKEQQLLGSFAAVLTGRDDASAFSVGCKVSCNELIDRVESAIPMVMNRSRKF